MRLNGTRHWHRLDVRLLAAKTLQTHSLIRLYGVTAWQILMVPIPLNLIEETMAWA